MPFVPVQIDRMVDPSFPGFVECAFVDALGQEHRFVEKVPVVSREDLSEDTSYPRIGNIACSIEASWLETDGRTLVRVSTLHPWGVESVEGKSQFVIAASIMGSDDAV
jgi:hypothetical protein